jgi:hypothetical protein
MTIKLIEISVEFEEKEIKFEIIKILLKKN